MNEDSDFQAQSISAGLQELQHLLENPVASSALELGTNAASAREYDVLKRLHKSLLQYVQRNGMLFYAGVLGHFSAGKSSTINSLLGIWNTPQERTTDLNPTDTTITLITKDKNSMSLLGVIKEGHVTIRLDTIESELLNELVLADTPGTGDPKFIEEVARDFLPICDLILFVFSAASPFDKSDVPLLLELYKRLPFIPIHFIVTRSDELRLDTNTQLTEDNLDTRRAEQFLNAVVVRVNTLLAPQTYVPSSFSLIDNKANFRVDKLIDFLRLRCNTSNPQSHISMHLNKLHFYRSGAKSLRTFFSQVLDKKLGELTRIVEAAKRNIERYQELVKISNSNLTQTWMEHVAAINGNGTLALNVVLLREALPQQLVGFRVVMTKRAELSRDLERSAKYHSGSIAGSLKAHVNGKLQERLYDLQKNIAGTPLQELNADLHTIVVAPKIAAPSLTEMQSSTSLYNQCFELRQAEAETLRAAAAQLRRSLGILHDQLTKRVPLTSAAQSIETAANSLRSDLDQFFQNVELYRSGVFSHTTKDSIATLGIGAKLDELETEFTDVDKGNFTLTASLDLFPGSQDLISTGTTAILALARRALETTEEMRSIQIERPSENKVAVEEVLLLAYEKLRNEVQAGLQNEIDRFCDGLSVTLGNLVVQAKSLADSDAAQLKRARLKRYGTAFVVTAIIFGCTSYAYQHFGKAAPSTITGEAALNVGCGLLVEALVLGIIKLRENAPKLLEQTRKQVHVKLQDEVRQVVEAQLKGLTLNSINEQALSTKIAKIYGQPLDLPAQAWQLFAKETLDGLQRFSMKYADLRTTYADLVDQIRKDSLQYFVDSTRNLSVLNQVASRIRNKAIEPSFALLEATRKELLSIKTQVDAIAFD